MSRFKQATVFLKITRSPVKDEFFVEQVMIKRIK